MPLTLQHTQETLCLCHIYALAGVMLESLSSVHSDIVLTVLSP
jgi:hypothetical protein